MGGDALGRATKPPQGGPHPRSQGRVACPAHSKPWTGPKCCRRTVQDCGPAFMPQERRQRGLGAPTLTLTLPRQYSPALPHCATHLHHARHHTHHPHSRTFIWRAFTSSVLPASRSSSFSPMQ